ncbi:hypothetical protein [Bradyrhizobium diazoefficiens]
MSQKDPDFFAHGWSKGLSQADEILAYKRDLPSGCKGFRDRATPQKK